MRIAVLFTIIIGILASCSSADKPPVLNDSNLQSVFVKISTDRDTSFKTPKGALIKIAKGTFDKEVELEIKEAYSIKDMLIAGLTTESDTSLLQSGGMVYINSKDGQPLKLNKAIAVVLPSSYVEENMKLYKAEMKNQQIGWEGLKSLDTTPLLSSIISGKQLFGKCASCHRFFKASTGPALAGITKRGKWSDPNELLAFLKNPPKYISQDNYTFNLKQQYGSVMQAFPDLTLNDVNNILSYIKNEENRGIVTGQFEEYNLRRDSLVSKTFPAVPKTNEISPINTNDITDTINIDQGDFEESLRNAFTDSIAFDNAYTFSIETLGWFNIDMDIQGLEGTALCKLDVELENSTESSMTVYLFVPGRKNLSVGIAESTSSFHFNKFNGAIPLFLNDRAFILAFSNSGDQFYYGITGFNVRKNQLIKIKVQQATKEQFLQTIKNEELEGLKISITKL